MLKLTVLQYFRTEWPSSALELCFGGLMWQNTCKPDLALPGSIYRENDALRMQQSIKERRH